MEVPKSGVPKNLGMGVPSKTGVPNSGKLHGSGSGL